MSVSICIMFNVILRRTSILSGHTICREQITYCETSNVHCCEETMEKTGSLKRGDLQLEALVLLAAATAALAPIPVLHLLPDSAKER
jgi:hypothetical protein